MRDYSAKIINDLIHVCKDIHPDLDNPDGSITGIYKRKDFEDLFQTNGRRQKEKAGILLKERMNNYAY